MAMHGAHTTIRPHTDPKTRQRYDRAQTTIHTSLVMSHVPHAAAQGGVESQESQDWRHLTVG